MKYILMFLVLASLTSCIVRDPSKYKTVSVTLIEIKIEHRLEEGRWVKEIWYIYQDENNEIYYLPIPISIPNIGIIDTMYLRQ